jgi:hypothetical protein
MLRKLFALLTAVTAALLLVGTAWAVGDKSGDTSTTTTIEEESTVSQPSSSIPDDNSTSTEVTTAGMEANEPTTSTTFDDVDQMSGRAVDDEQSDQVDEDEHTTTTVDDDQVSADLDIPAADYPVDGAGAVRLEVKAGILTLVGVNANDGWTFQLKDASDHELKIRFTDGSTEVEFEAEVEHSKIDVSISSETDD